MQGVLQLNRDIIKKKEKHLWTLDREQILLYTEFIKCEVVVKGTLLKIFTRVSISLCRRLTSSPKDHRKANRPDPVTLWIPAGNRQLVGSPDQVRVAQTKINSYLKSSLMNTVKPFQYLCVCVCACVWERSRFVKLLLYLMAGGWTPVEDLHVLGKDGVEGLVSVDHRSEHHGLRAEGNRGSLTQEQSSINQLINQSVLMKSDNTCWTYRAERKQCEGVPFLFIMF